MPFNYNPLSSQFDEVNSGSSGSSPLTTKGDLYTYDTADARLPIGDFSNNLSVSGTGDLVYKSRRNWVTYYDDFLHWQAGDWSRNGSGSGNVSTFSVTPTDANHPGQWMGRTGTTTTGHSRLQLYENSMRVAGGKVRFETCVNLEALSDAGETFTIRVGFTDNTTGGDGTDAVFFRYTHGTHLGNWDLVTRASNSETSTDSSVAVTIDWTNLAFEINATGTLVTYYVNGASVGTNATNIPTATLGVAFSITKSAGTSSREMHSDYVDLNIELTNTR